MRAILAHHTETDERKMLDELFSELPEPEPPTAAELDQMYRYHLERGNIEPAWELRFVNGVRLIYVNDKKIGTIYTRFCDVDLYTTFSHSDHPKDLMGGRKWFETEEEAIWDLYESYIKRQIDDIRPVPWYQTWSELESTLNENYGQGNWEIRGNHVCYRHEGACDNPATWSSYYKVCKRGDWYEIYDPHRT